MPVPNTLAQARIWWRVLAGYLDMQIEAELLGEWDERFAWPHGEAALWVQIAETLESRLPVEVSRFARSSNASIRASAPCPCNSGRAADRCHLPILQDLSVLRNKAKIAEDAYWESYAGTSCCGTLKQCRLRAGTPVYLRSSVEYLGSRW
jgi:hypothetical protein